MIFMPLEVLKKRMLSKRNRGNSLNFDKGSILENTTVICVIKSPPIMWCILIVLVLQLLLLLLFINSTTQTLYRCQYSSDLHNIFPEHSDGLPWLNSKTGKFVYPKWPMEGGNFHIYHAV